MDWFKDLPIESKKQAGDNHFQWIILKRWPYLGTAIVDTQDIAGRLEMSRPKGGLNKTTPLCLLARRLRCGNLGRTWLSPVEALEQSHAKRVHHLRVGHGVKWIRQEAWQGESAEPKQRRLSSRLPSGRRSALRYSSLSGFRFLSTPKSTETQGFPFWGNPPPLKLSRLWGSQKTQPWSLSHADTGMNFKKGPLGGHQNSGIHVHQPLWRGFPIKLH